MADELILIDLDDQQIGTMDKVQTHRLGRLHRAFSIFIIKDHQMLLQKRNRNKYHSGGLWANSCCSHPRNGETLSEAVKRRLAEELGIRCEVDELFSFVYFSKYAEDLFEYEYDHVFLGSYDGECYFDTEEIEELRWVDIETLKSEMLIEPEKFTSWFMIAAPRIFQILAEKQNYQVQDRKIT